jgi:hypothetical protein
VSAEHALADDGVRRVMTIPGIDVVTATTLCAVIGDVGRFPTPRHLVGHLGLHPTVRQSGLGPTRTHAEGGLRRRGHVLVEAAWSAAKSPGPLRALAERTAARRGRHVAAVAVARKLAVLAWHLLSREEDYAFAGPSLIRRKLRRLELSAGAAAAKPGPSKAPIWGSATREGAERRVAEQAEAAYRRADRRLARGPEAGRGRDTGARIFRAVFAARSAADLTAPEACT